MVAACEGFIDLFEMTFLRLLAVGGDRGRFAGVVDERRGVDQCGVVLAAGGEPLLVGAFQNIHATGQKFQLRFSRARLHYISIVAILTGAYHGRSTEFYIFPRYQPRYYSEWPLDTGAESVTSGRMRGAFLPVFFTRLSTPSPPASRIGPGC